MQHFTLEVIDYRVAIDKKMEKFIIRKAVEDDIKQISKLLYEVQKVHSDARPDLFKSETRKYNDDELKEIIKDDNKPIFVALIDEDIVGYAFCVISNPHASTMVPIKNLYIDDLCVDEKCRGKHIGKLLYDYVVNFTESINCYNVTLNVWADNINAVKFYEKLGLKVQKIGMEKIIEYKNK